jgi:hypothetical protein
MKTRSPAAVWIAPWAASSPKWYAMSASASTRKTLAAMAMGMTLASSTIQRLALEGPVRCV